MNNINPNYIELNENETEVIIISDEYLLNQNELHVNDLRSIRNLNDDKYDNLDTYNWEQSTFDNHNNDCILIN